MRSAVVQGKKAYPTLLGVSTDGRNCYGVIWLCRTDTLVCPARFFATAEADRQPLAWARDKECLSYKNLGALELPKG
jgi:hypothetical protein